MGALKDYDVVIPEKVRAYFQHKDAKGEPVVFETFRAGEGWRKLPYTARITRAYAEGLRRQGVEQVAIGSERFGEDGWKADFTVRELLEDEWGPVNSFPVEDVTVRTRTDRRYVVVWLFTRNDGSTKAEILKRTDNYGKARDEAGSIFGRTYILDRITGNVIPRSA